MFDAGELFQIEFKIVKLCAFNKSFHIPLCFINISKSYNCGVCTIFIGEEMELTMADMFVNVKINNQHERLAKLGTLGNPRNNSGYCRKRIFHFHSKGLLFNNV